MIDFQKFIKSLSDSKIEIHYEDSEGKQKITHEIGNIKVEFDLVYDSEITHEEPETYLTPAHTERSYRNISHDEIFLFHKGLEMDTTEEELEEIDNSLFKILYL